MVHDESMVPTLHPGDRLLVDLRAYRDRPPAVGDIVVFTDPDLADRWLVKRVAGVGPGRFQRTATGLAPATMEPARPGMLDPLRAAEVLDLPSGTVYVTGDAPGTRDSRIFGPVSFSALVGRAYRCYAPPTRRRDL